MSDQDRPWTTMTYTFERKRQPDQYMVRFVPELLPIMQEILTEGTLALGLCDEVTFDTCEVEEDDND